ncbi:MAG: alcohol dehydrogenase catalytic domain-containing protein, partial [Chlamydiales bacterium]
MKVITLNPKTRQLRIGERPEPQIKGDHEVKLKILEVGICGTDREEVAGGRAFPPPGEAEIILGHETIAEVVEVGSKVTHFKKGDFAAITVRRGCGKCSACLGSRADLCYSGNYTERGIKGEHGFNAEFVLEEERYLVKVPPELKFYGVLTEPMSVVEKAIDELLNIQQARLADWKDASLFKHKKALVAGLGPIGLLACFALRLQGFQLFGLDIVDPGTTRTSILEEIGGTYLDGRKIKASEIPEKIGQIDLILEA